MTGQKRYWLDSAENVTKLYRALWAIGIALVLAELFVDKHEDLAFAGWFAFYALFGFVACVILVVTAKALRRVLKRPEDYYGER
jgi:peptidoglycan/LPS O-acetylase OafA/YrhL